MKRNKTWFSLGLVALSALALTLMLIVLPVGADHDDPERGIVTVEPAVVSSNEAGGVSNADRTITVRVTDINMNAILFVGKGPDDEASGFADFADDEPLAFPGDIADLDADKLSAGTVLLTLQANGGQTTSVADRNDDGLINTDDIEIVYYTSSPVHPNHALEGTLRVDQIYDAERGRIGIGALLDGMNGQTFGVRYATSEKDLTRAVQTFTETITLALPVAADATFSLILNPDNLPLQNTDGSKDINDIPTIDEDDISISIGGVSDGDTPTIDEFAINHPITVGDGDGTVSSSTISLTNGPSPLDTGTMIEVTYLGLKDLVEVTGPNGEDIPLRLLETGPNTGVFEATVEVFNGDDGEDDIPGNNLKPSAETGVRPQLAITVGSSVVVSYHDRSPNRTIAARVQVESELPSFSNTMPADGTITNNLNTVLTTEVVDNIAGVDPDSVEVTIAIGGTSETIDTDNDNLSVVETFEGSGVYTVEYNVNNIDDIADAIEDGTDIEIEIFWEIRVADNAGNAGSTNVTNDAGTPVNLMLTISSYPPALIGAFTGDNWDEDADAGERLRSSRPDLPGSDMRTSIRLEFDRAMKGSSLQTSDFRVGGVAPADVDHFSELPESVFLTVSEMDPNATPRIEVVGDIQDVGGTELEVDDPEAAVIEDANDGIAPRLEVTVVDDYTDGAIGLLANSDEPIIGSLPGRTIYKCQSEYLDADGMATTTETTTTSLVCDIAVSNVTTSSTIVQNQLEWSFNVTGFDPGLYSVLVEAQDTQSNLVEVGSQDPTAAGAITFEIDDALPAAASTDPAEGGTKSEAEPFIIEINWTSEADDEYDGDGHTAVALSKAVLNAGMDNEQDVMALSSTRDDQVFSIAISGIEVGDHTLTYNGMDEMGHALEDDAVLNFTVASPAPFNLTLSPGVNLVSVPRDPRDPSIQEVFGDIEDITLVFTRPFAGESDLPWLIAVRDPVTGEFVGDLTSIDARHAYWIKASATRSVEIQTPPLEAQRVPPTIPVKSGVWSLVPVISLAPIGSGEDGISEGTEFHVNAYFGTDNWSKAFTFDRGQWIGITPDVEADHNATTLYDSAQIGRGYWVLFTEDGTLTPGIPEIPGTPE